VVREPAADDASALSRLLEITQDILQAHELEPALHSIARGVADLFGFKYVTIVASDAPGGELYRRVLLGYSPDIVHERMGEHVPRTDILHALDPEHQVFQNCYYIPFERDFPWPRTIFSGDLPKDAARPDATQWHERDYLILVITDRAGEMLGYMSVDHPISGKVPSRETLREMQLFVNLAGLALANSRSHAAEVERRRMLEETTRTQNEFFTMVAHEVRSPLAAIRGATSLLETHFDTMESERRADLLGVLGSSTARLGTIFEDFLLLSRMDAGKLALRAQNVDPLQTAHESIARMKSEHMERDFRIVSADVLPFVRADEGRVVQILTNLLSNAAKYSDPDSSILLHVQPEAEHVRFAVENTGPGIPPDERNKLFTRFGRLSRSDDSFATGLGLYISAKLCTAMGGVIGCDSAPGETTTFWFTLPLAQPQANA